MVSAGMSLSLDGCPRVFIDGGANDGDGVRAFLDRRFHGCAMSGPSRLYPKAWTSLDRRGKQAVMAPLGEPSSWCIRSFEANPKLWPLLHAQEASLGARAKSLRFVDGALSNRSGSSPRTVVTYSAAPAGSMATAYEFEDIFPKKPTRLATEVVRVPSYDVRDVLDEALRQNRSAVVALKLDVEGDEAWVMDRLFSAPDVLCSLTYLYVEWHHLPGQRVNLTKYGLRDKRANLTDEYDRMKDGVHALMERPGCRLKVYWRSFWAACGDPQRFEWISTEQALGHPPPAKGKGKGRRRGRRRGR